MNVVSVPILVEFYRFTDYELTNKFDLQNKQKMMETIPMDCVEARFVFVNVHSWSNT